MKIRRYQAGRIVVASGLMGLMLLALNGCVATTTDVDRLADSMKGMQKTQADLVVKMQELDQDLVRLREELSMSQQKMSQLTQKLDDTHSGLGTKMTQISNLLSAATTHAAVEVPGELYRSAEGDYRTGKVELAISGFRLFLNRYPQSDLAEDAQYYLADSLLLQKDYVQARVEFDVVLSKSRRYRKIALLKRARALAGVEKIPDQVATLQQLIKEFPKTSEADLAQQSLDQISAEQKKKEDEEKKQQGELLRQQSLEKAAAEEKKAVEEKLVPGGKKN